MNEMQNPIRCRASVVVRAAIAHHLDMPVAFVLESHELDGDLDLDALDLSLIAIVLAEEVGTELDFSRLPNSPSVNDLAELAAEAMLGLIDVLLEPMRLAAGAR